MTNHHEANERFMIRLACLASMGARGLSLASRALGGRLRLEQGGIAVCELTAPDGTTGVLIHSDEYNETIWEF